MELMIKRYKELFDYDGEKLRWKINKGRARIKIDGRIVGLGVYETREEASRAYFLAAKEIHGEFAKESIL